MNDVVKATPLTLSNEPQSESGALMALIERAAMSSDIDVDKLDKLLSVKERWDAQQAKREYDEAMSRFRSQAPIIRKNAQGHNSKYAKLDQVVAQVQPIMQSCGFSHSWRTNQGDDDRVQVTCIVSHIGGHSEETSLKASPDTSGAKNSIQAIASAVTYLERYTLLAILGLATAEMDDDGASADIGPAITAEQAARLRDELEAADRDEGKFCQYMKVTKLEDIPAINFDSALKTIQNAAKAASK